MKIKWIGPFYNIYVCGMVRLTNDRKSIFLNYANEYIGYCADINIFVIQRFGKEKAFRRAYYMHTKILQRNKIYLFPFYISENNLHIDKKKSI